MSDLGVPEIEELIGAYALDAVDGDERDAVEQHLAVCARCRSELADHLEVAALLAYQGNGAPSDVWDRIVASLEEPPPALRLTVDAPAPVVSIEERRRSKLSQRVLAGTAAVAAAVALVLGVVVVTRDTPASVTADLAQVAGEAIADPASSKTTLRPPEGAPGPEATAVVRPDGAGFLVAADLPALEVDRTYQLWGVLNDQVISLGVLGSDPGVAAFQVDDVGAVTAFAITEEVSGGVVSSQNEALLVGELA